MRWERHNLRDSRGQGQPYAVLQEYSHRLRAEESELIQGQKYDLHNALPQRATAPVSYKAL